MHYSPQSEAKPAVTSGYGSVMEQERELQSSTGGCLEAVSGPHAREVDGILRQQQVRLGANIALLERRCESLPHPGRFLTLQKRFTPLARARRVAPAESIGLLPDLVARHVNLLQQLTALIA